MSTDPFADLPDKDRTPRSARILDGWVRDAQKRVSSRGERVSWILASTIVTAALQRELRDETPVFLLKGGVFIERVLDLNARATKDVDTLYRGAESDLVDHIDRALAEPWGEITLSRSEIEVIEKAHRVIKPRRFQAYLDIQGIRWRRIQVEVSFAEGASAENPGIVVAPATSFFGIAKPDDLVTISLAYQVAQKFHAATDPDSPPEFVNDRVRDIVDLTLIREAFFSRWVGSERVARCSRGCVHGTSAGGRSAGTRAASVATGHRSQRRVARHLAHPGRAGGAGHRRGRCHRCYQRMDRRHRQSVRRCK